MVIFGGGRKMEENNFTKFLGETETTLASRLQILGTGSP